VRHPRRLAPDISTDHQAATASITDAGIALSLIWELGQLRGATAFAESRSLIHRLIGRAIVTGSVTAVLAIITRTLPSRASTNKY
jgi:hypothetical protein